MPETMLNHNLKYSAKDKPWLRYYSEEEMNAPLPTGSLYEYMHTRNADRMDSPAITFMGKTITHRRFDDQISACARALLANHVKKGDIVSVCMLSAPEALVLLYAINRIGAVCSFVVFNAPEEEIHKQILAVNSRIVFTVDLAAAKIEKAIRETAVAQVITVPLSNSMALLYRLAVEFKTRKLPIPADFLPWKKFIAAGEGKELPEIKVQENDLAVLEYTSGTTGDSKGAMLTNLSINSAAFNYCNAGNVFEFHDGERFLSIVPPFLSFGLITTMAMPLCARFELILAPDPAPECMPKNIKKYKPNHFCSGSLHVEAIINDPQIAKMDLSFLSTASYGGEKIDPHWEQKVSEFFFAHGMKHKLVNGYGLTEVSGSFCTTTHKTGFMIPFAKNNVMITDIDTDETLDYEQEGQICLSGPSLMSGYYNRPDATAEAMFERDGLIWLKTGDIGKLSADGSFSVTGRLKRILYAVGESGAVFRVYPMRIEEVICSCEDVSHCGVVGRQDNTKGFLPVAFVVPKDHDADRDALIEKLKTLCESKLSKTEQPCEFVIIDSMPTTRAGKVDFKKLEKIANEP